MKCKWCGFTCDSSKEFEEHLITDHFLNYQQYSEIELLNPLDEDSICLKCNNFKNPLTTLSKNYYYLPCWDCFDKISKKIEKQSIIENVQKNIKSYFDYFLGDRYLQLFSINNIYFNSTYSHNYSEFKKVLSFLSLPSRNDIWLIDWVDGFPKIISTSNLEGLKVVNLSKMYNIVSEKDSIEVNNYKILLPEESVYDKQHFSRYNIINLNSDRKRQKKIRLDSGCIKFYNNDNINIKSILKVVDKNTGDPININDINYQDYVIIKLVIMRNKNYMRLIFSIIQEIMKSVNIIRDSVFLRNTIRINPSKDLSLNLSWTGKTYFNNFINISIL